MADGSLKIVVPACQLMLIADLLGLTRGLFRPF